MIKIIINGINGKMGRAMQASLAHYPHIEIVAGLGKQDHLATAIKETGAEVVVDLTTPHAVVENTHIILDSGAHPVIGTTGMPLEQLDIIRERCDSLQRGAIIAPNFSIAAVLMLRAAQQIAHYLPQVEIVEYHHEQKIDAPSGTALKTAEVIARARDATKLSATENSAAARGLTHHDIPIHAIRLPGFVASQEVIFGNSGETLKIRHDTINRDCFVPGLVLCIERVRDLKKLVYGLENLLM